MAGLPVEADIRRADASQCGESRPSFLDHLVAHAFDDIRDRIPYRANLAAIELTGRRNRGLKNRWQSGAVIHAELPEWNTEPTRCYTREVRRKPTPAVVFHAKDDRYGPTGIESDCPFPVGGQKRIRCDSLDIEVFGPRALDKSAPARAGEILVRRLVWRHDWVSGNDVHGEAVLQQVCLAFITFVIAVRVLPLNSGSCDEFENTACLKCAPYFRDTQLLPSPDQIRNGWDSDTPIMCVVRPRNGIATRIPRCKDLNKDSKRPTRRSGDCLPIASRRTAAGSFSKRPPEGEVEAVSASERVLALG
jgi:hypothetical protein